MRTQELEAQLDEPVTHDQIVGDWHVYQLRRGHRFSTDDLLVAWTAIKAAATRAVTDAGGTVTHHHAVGRMHRDGYDKQRPALFAEALKAVKGTLDPHGILNPGILIDA